MHTIITRSGAEFWWNINRPENDKFIVPKNIAFYEITHPFRELKSVTWEEIHANRRIKQENRLDHLRRMAQGPVVKPCFIWVFYNDNFLFTGWWIYIKTLKEDYPLNFRTHRNDKLIKKIMSMFQCGALPLDFEIWAQAFAKTYHHVGFGRTVQGLVPCYCQIDYPEGHIQDVFLKYSHGRAL